jgi:hypothetical protein
MIWLTRQVNPQLNLDLIFFSKQYHFNFKKKSWNTVVLNWIGLIRPTYNLTELDNFVWNNKTKSQIEYFLSIVIKSIPTW